jgi:DivIVA domain-containing protein
VIWVLFIVVAVLVVGGFAALISGRIGYDPLSEPTTTQGDPGLGEDFAARDVADVHFDTALRGYRMDQVDAVLDRLQDRIADLETRIAAQGGGEQPEHTHPAP